MNKYYEDSEFGFKEPQETILRKCTPIFQQNKNIKQTHYNNKNTFKKRYFSSNNS